MIRIIIRIISGFVFLLSIIWFYKEGGFEPVITALTGFTGFLSSFYKRKTVKKSKEELATTKSTEQGTSVTEVDISELPKEAIGILGYLKTLKNGETVLSDIIAERFNLNHQLAVHLLEKLQDDDLVTGPYHSDEGQRYCLSKRGRAIIFGDKDTANISKFEKSRFPPSDWLTGKDLIKEYNLSSNELVQHIEAGLSVYDENTDIYYEGIKPLEIEELWLRLADKNEFLEKELPSLLFRRIDIEQYISSKTYT